MCKEVRGYLSECMHILYVSAGVTVVCAIVCWSSEPICQPHTHTHNCPVVNLSLCVCFCLSPVLSVSPSLTPFVSLLCWDIQGNMMGWEFNVG